MATPNFAGPAYRELAESLKKQIADGRLPVGEPIPSTARLCAEHGVSATVARAAVSELRSAGLVRGQPGKAVYVVATPQEVEEDRVTLEGVAARLEELERNMGELTELVSGSLGENEVNQLREEVARQRKMIGDLHGQLMELYMKTGVPYSYDTTSHETSNDTRATGTDARR